MHGLGEVWRVPIKSQRDSRLHGTGKCHAGSASAARAQLSVLAIRLVPEGKQILPTLTVEENLIATAHNKLGQSSPWTLDRVYTFFPRLKERAKNLGSQLSGGEQQMLAIGRALMTNPRLLVLDKATEGAITKLTKLFRRLSLIV
jgi:ABC-type branched-subunit amino acid transport system ATPase component